MKTKLILLIISILCLSVLLVACDEPCETHVDENGDAACDVCGEAVETQTESETETETETEGICDHTDVDADKLCDNCGKAVVVIVERVPVETETAVDMIVNPIPDDVNLEDYINTTLPTHEYLSEGSKLSGIQAWHGSYLFIKTEDENYYSYDVYDVANGEYVWDSTFIFDTDHIKWTTKEVTLKDNWFVVQTVEWKRNETGEIVEGKRTIQILTYALDEIGVAHVVGLEGEGEYVEPVTNYVEGDQECYVSYQGKIFVIDPATGKIIHTDDPDTYIERPEFDVVNGHYGYVFDYEMAYDDNGEAYESAVKGIYVYDTDFWVKSVYSYEVASYQENANITVLSNGNILVWYYKALPDSAVSYDFLWGVDKYDLIVVSPVVDGYVDYNQNISLIVDGSLNIICKLPFSNVDLIDDGLFIDYIHYNDDTFACEIVNAKGEHIAYLPENGNYNLGYKRVGDKLYGYDNELLIDLGEKNLFADVTDYYGGYVIYTEEVKVDEENTKTAYYLYVVGGEAVELSTEKDNWMLVSVTEYGFQIAYTVTSTTDEGEVTNVVYEFYNPANELVMSSERMLVEIGSVSEDVVVAYDTAYEMYILK